MNSKTFDNDAFEWLDKNELSYQIWNNKYRHGGETLEEWLDRVSGKNTDIKELLRQKKFMFGGRTLANRGLNNGSLSNCYSRGYVGDSLSEIMNACKDLALTYKAQGGQGLSLSQIRPKGAIVNKDFVSDGIVPFMKMFNCVTSSVSQGNSRRGALLMSCDVWHKDIEDFITIKSKEGEIENANLSVEIDDYFMDCVMSDIKDVEVVRNYGGKEYKYVVNVPKIWNLICKYAHDHAEPGIIFTNRFRNYNLMEFVDDYQIETANPCSEQPLPKNGCCNLLSINLSAYVRNKFEKDAFFDYTNFFEDLLKIHKASDEIIDENLPFHALKEQRDMAEKYRNCGMGIMGLAETFAYMNMVYGSPESKDLLSKIMGYYFKGALISSSVLASLKGAMPGYSDNIWKASILKDIYGENDLETFVKDECKLRNCSLLSIAPTGSISTMLNISGGIEPWFATSYERRTVSLDGKESVYNVNVKALSEYHEKFGCDAKSDLFVTAKDIDYNDRIEMQSICQRFVDTAISSTINLPKNTSIDTIKDIYLKSWQLGLKGVTVYVDGSRKPILSTDGFDNGKFNTHSAPKRPTTLKCDSYSIKSDGEYFIVFVGLMEDKPYEVFIKPIIELEAKLWGSKKEGKITKVAKRHYRFESDGISIENIAFEDNSNVYRQLTIHISAMLRHGMPIDCIVKLEQKCNPLVTSFNKAICRVLSKYMKEMSTDEKCPDCGKTLVHDNGCKRCPHCGYSKCLLIKSKKYDKVSKTGN